MSLIQSDVSPPTRLAIDEQLAKMDIPAHSPHITLLSLPPEIIEYVLHQLAPPDPLWRWYSPAKELHVEDEVYLDTLTKLSLTCSLLAKLVKPILYGTVFRTVARRAGDREKRTDQSADAVWRQSLLQSYAMETSSERFSRMTSFDLGPISVDKDFLPMIKSAPKLQHLDLNFGESVSLSIKKDYATAIKRLPLDRLSVNLVQLDLQVKDYILLEIFTLERLSHLRLHIGYISERIVTQREPTSHKLQLRGLCLIDTDPHIIRWIVSMIRCDQVQVLSTDWNEFSQSFLDTISHAGFDNIVDLYAMNSRKSTFALTPAWFQAFPKLKRLQVEGGLPLYGSQTTHSVFGLPTGLRELHLHRCHALNVKPLCEAFQEQDSETEEPVLPLLERLHVDERHLIRRADEGALSKSQYWEMVPALMDLETHCLSRGIAYSPAGVRERWTKMHIEQDWKRFYGVLYQS